MKILKSSYNLRTNIRTIKKYIKWGKISLESIYKKKEEHKIDILLNPGEEYTFELSLNKYKEYVLNKHLIMISLYIRYTNSRSKELYILINNPVLFAEPNINVMTIKDNWKVAEELFYQTAKKLKLLVFKNGRDELN